MKKILWLLGFAFLCIVIPSASGMVAVDIADKSICYLTKIKSDGTPTWIKQKNTTVNSTKNSIAAAGNHYITLGTNRSIWYRTGAPTDVSDWKGLNDNADYVAITSDGKMLIQNGNIKYAASQNGMSTNWITQSGTNSIALAAAAGNYYVHIGPDFWVWYCNQEIKIPNNLSLWSSVDSPNVAKQVAINEKGQMLCIGTDNQVRYSSGVTDNAGKKTANWKIQAGTNAICVATSGNVFAYVDNNNAIWYFVGTPDADGKISWKKLGGTFKAAESGIAITDPKIFSTPTTDTNSNIFTYDPSAGMASATAYYQNGAWKSNTPGNISIVLKVNASSDFYIQFSPNLPISPATNLSVFAKNTYSIIVGGDTASYKTFLIKNGVDTREIAGMFAPSQIAWGTDVYCWASIEDNKKISFGLGQEIGKNKTISWDIDTPNIASTAVQYIGFGGYQKKSLFTEINVIKPGYSNKLEYNKIITINTNLGPVWTSPSNRHNDKNKSFEPLVGGNANDPQLSNGANFFLIKSATTPNKTGPIKYGDDIEIYSLATTAAPIKVWPMTRKWVAFDTSHYCKEANQIAAKQHCEIFIAEQSDNAFNNAKSIVPTAYPNATSKSSIFKIINPQNESDVSTEVMLGANVRIISTLKNASGGLLEKQYLWTGEQLRGNTDSPSKEILIRDWKTGTDARYNSQGTFTFGIPNNDPNKVTESLTLQSPATGTITPADFPANFTAISSNADIDKITIGSKDGKLEVWAIDNNDKVYRFNENAGAPYSMPDAVIDPWELQTLKDETGAVIPGSEDIFATCDGNLFAIRSDDKTAIKYDFAKKIWTRLKITNTPQIKLSNITASKGSEVFVTSEDNKIYKLESNNALKFLTNGLSVAAGIGTDGKSIVIGIAKTENAYRFDAGKYIPMGTEKLKKITIGNQNYILAVTSDDRLVKWDSKTSKWVNVPGANDKTITNVDDIAAIPSEATVALDKFGKTYHKGSDGIIVKNDRTINVIKNNNENTVTNAIKNKKIKPGVKKPKTFSKKTNNQNIKKAKLKAPSKAITPAPAAPGVATPAPAAPGVATPAPAAPGVATPPPAAPGVATPPPAVAAHR